jgi:hypothetical protein
LKGCASTSISQSELGTRMPAAGVLGRYQAQLRRHLQPLLELACVTDGGHDGIGGDRAAPPTAQPRKCSGRRYTHCEPIEPAPTARHGVNLRNFEPALLESVVVRRFDGADTRKFLD